MLQLGSLIVANEGAAALFKGVCVCVCARARALSLSLSLCLSLCLALSHCLHLLTPLPLVHLFLSLSFSLLSLFAGVTVAVAFDALVSIWGGIRYEGVMWLARRPEL